MSYKIIGDSCTDLTKEMRQDSHFQIVPLCIDIDGYQIVDDETFDQKDFLKRIEESPNCPKSSCPSPDAYMKAYDYDADHIYVITISSKLSGSYESAMLAKRLYQEEHPEKLIEVFDSRSASVGQTLIAINIQHLEEQGASFDEVVAKVNDFRDHMKTKFVLESLETLRKNGRLTNIKAILCSALNIKPLMRATEEGTIEKIDQARGINKTLHLMAEHIKKDATHVAERTLAIAHCNNYERAVFVKEEIMKIVPFKDSLICDTAGISSLFANEGGIIVSY